MEIHPSLFFFFFLNMRVSMLYIYDSGSGAPINTVNSRKSQLKHANFTVAVN